MPAGPAPIALVAAPPADANPANSEAIRHVARELEGLFLREVLRVMRETVPEGALMQGGLAGDIYSGMLDQELAARAGDTGGLGLADLIAQQLGAQAPPAAARVAAAYRIASRGSRWVHPLPDGPSVPMRAGSRFGAPRATGGSERVHMGVDLAAPIGTPVRAVCDGIVERVERDEDRGGRAGRYVRVAHAGGIVTRYLHLDLIRDDLRPGDRIRGGETLGTVGRTGVRRSGPHLHFTVSRREGGPGTTESYIDPAGWLSAWRRGIPADPAKVGPTSDEVGTMGGLQ